MITIFLTISCLPQLKGKFTQIIRFRDWDEGLTSQFLANIGYPPQKRSELNANGSREKVILNAAGVQPLHGPTVASNTICCLDNLSPRAFPGSHTATCERP